MSVQSTTRSRPVRRPLARRDAILNAAVREFSDKGLSGARTDAIARSARVNKALLYYYFQDKEALYGAVLDEVLTGLVSVVEDALSVNATPRKRILGYAGAHFDYIASHPFYSKIVQAELMRARTAHSSHFDRMTNEYFKPLFAKLSKVVQEGIALGEFRRVDPQQFIPSMIAVIVFYFSSAHVMRLMSGSDPFTPERLAERRAAVLDFISAALFYPEFKKGVRS
jgi:TetR/AcrR family transcriptional regulator